MQILGNGKMKISKNVISELMLYFDIVATEDRIGFRSMNIKHNDGIKKWMQGITEEFSSTHTS